MQTSLQDQVVFVTGSARRVGREILLAFAQAGAHVVVHHGHSPQEAEATAETARTFGVEPLVVQGDHTQYDEIEANFKAVQAHFGRLDVLVNSAGAFQSGDLLDITPEDWQFVLDLNVSAPWWCTQFAGRLMRDTGIAGNIINIGDNGGLRPWVKRPHHSISKAAIVMLTQVTARALGEYGIRCNCIVPGPVLPSPGMSDAYWEQVTARLPLGRSGTPADVAQAALFIAQNDFITGAVLRVDGGEYLDPSMS
ncbi:MAG: SDR family NAD(P)-dependent oxidoreductase [Anaerolineales bacterium]